jgi:hypothetical protein
MHVEECQPIALAKPHAHGVCHGSARLLEGAGRHVPWNDGIRHAGQSPVPQMNVRTAHLGERRAEQRAARRQLRLRELAQLDGLARRGHDSGYDHETGR